ncbi:MAG: S8 family serine peptidase [Eubacteriales bacterium]
MVHDYYVVIVAANANLDESRGVTINHISSIAASYNAIAVGNVDSNGVIKSTSCYSLMSNTNMAYRPDLCAIGQMYYLYPYSDTQISGSGTSYSSPTVAGAIALLMQHCSDLTIAPELTKAVISASTRTGMYQYCLYGSIERAGYEKYGAGTLDCYRAYQLLNSGTYDFPIFNTFEGNTNTFSVNLLAGHTRRLSVAYVKNNSCEYVDGRRPSYDVFYSYSYVIQ